MRTALVVVNSRIDFHDCPAASRYRGDPAALDAAASNVARAVDAARAHGTEVVLVGDAVRPTCLEGLWGAESPVPGRACFDAFVGDGFEERLAACDVGHLVFAGFCVDPTARTAFRKGFQITVLTDCTTSPHLPDADLPRFTTVGYGARATTHEQLFAEEEEDRWSAPSIGIRAWRTASA